MANSSRDRPPDDRDPQTPTGGFPPLPPASPRGQGVRARLSDTEATEVLSQLTQAMLSSGALVDGLRAASLESTSRRVAAALANLAAEIERGQELSAALTTSATQMPVHVRGLVAAACRTGRLGDALDDLIEYHRSLRANFWSIWGSLLYPFVVLAIALFVLSFFMVWIVPLFAEMFRDFDLKLPAATLSLLQASEAFQWLISRPTRGPLLVLLVVVGGLAVIAATGRGGVWLQRAVASMPILGPLWTWSGAAAFMHLLATLLDYDVPLPEALRLTAAGAKNAELRRVGGWLAERVAGGELLSQLVDSSGCLPCSAVPILHWGERQGSLGEAARTVASLFQERVQSRTAWLRSISPPVIYLFVIVSLGFSIFSLFAPMLSLISGLS